MSAYAFSENDVRAIFMHSEGVAVSDGRRIGHTGQRHVNASNRFLDQRMQDARQSSHNNGRILAITSFITFADAVWAGAQVLNSAAAEPILVDFYKARPRFEPWTLKHVELPRPLIARYAQGGGAKTFPCRYATMVIDKNTGRPSQMHIRTFFPTLGMD
ncbi:hypothetical protein [Caulobacter sp. UNC279MFTsu5.1]|uniref:hypothetical protein n=1 Tax=Caulobacter sp. UNC279MFTsu5.1 TaxID=1502775 RepID=UPI001160B3DD|nr:hypothetical protein [Caulobacter sp. UNC279MFTsu5.1]